MSPWGLNKVGIILRNQNRLRLNIKIALEPEVKWQRHPKANTNKRLLFLDGIVTLVSDACCWRPLGEQNEEIGFLWGFEEQVFFFLVFFCDEQKAFAYKHNQELTGYPSPVLRTLQHRHFYYWPFTMTPLYPPSKHANHIIIGVHRETNATQLTEFYQLPSARATFS